MKPKAVVFNKSIVALVFCIIISLIYVQKGDKERSAFQSVSGVLLSLQNIHERYSGKDTSKYRYIEIDRYPQPFQIFIGKSAGDFKPTYEQIGNLKPGDSLTIYFDESNRTRNEAVNNLAYFIDRGSETIFIKGNSIKTLIYGLIVFCIGFIILLIFLKLKGMID